MDLMGGLGGAGAAGGFWDDVNEDGYDGGYNDTKIDITNENAGDGSTNSQMELTTHNQLNGGTKKKNPFGTFENEDDPSNYMDIYESLKNDIKLIEKNTKLLNKLTERYNQSTTKQENADIMTELDNIMANNSDTSVSIKKRLKIESENNETYSQNNVGSSVAQWRINQLNSCTRRFKDATNSFQDTLNHFQSSLRSKQRRHIDIVADKNLTDDQKEAMVDDYEAAQEYIQQQFAMNDTSDAMLDRLTELEDRHKGMLRIEQSIRELQEMWTELHILISEQQEYIDQIENNVMMTKDYVKSAVKQIKSAEVHQKKARKASFYLLICCVIFCLIVLSTIFGFVFRRK
mmetsp:Transcript_20265/g.24991  ORF Transcript_20265/g.24991 Transcript_20265/m.24991 type:complete len:346 (+) Transcript_20265:84-1121(+)